MGYKRLVAFLYCRGDSRSELEAGRRRIRSSNLVRSRRTLRISSTFSSTESGGIPLAFARDRFRTRAAASPIAKPSTSDSAGDVVSDETQCTTCSSPSPLFIVSSTSSATGSGPSSLVSGSISGANSLPLAVCHTVIGAGVGDSGSQISRSGGRVSWGGVRGTAYICAGRCQHMGGVGHAPRRAIYVSLQHRRACLVRWGTASRRCGLVAPINGV